MINAPFFLKKKEHLSSKERHEQTCLRRKSESLFSNNNMN